MYPSKHGLAGALIGGFMAWVLPGPSRVFIGLAVLLIFNRIPKEIDSSLENKYGQTVWYAASLVLGPIITMTRGTLEEILSFFYFFVLVAVGYILGLRLARPLEETDEFDEID